MVGGGPGGERVVGKGSGSIMVGRQAPAGVAAIGNSVRAKGFDFLCVISCTHMRSVFLLRYFSNE